VSKSTGQLIELEHDIGLLQRTKEKLEDFWQEGPQQKAEWQTTKQTNGYKQSICRLKVVMIS